MASDSHAHEYESRLEWTGNAGTGTESYTSYGRGWIVRIAGKPDLHGSANAAFRGDARLYDPEDLFVAALSSCHMLSYLSLCARHGVRVLAYEDRATGTLLLEPGGGGRFSEVVLRPVVAIASGADVGLARELHDRAHERCFIASSVAVPVRHEATIVEANAAPAAGGER